MIESVTFVVPSYRTAETLPILIDRLELAAPAFADRYEVLVVDDACPERSGATVVGRRCVRVVGFDTNQGQRTAVLVGMSMSTSDVVCVMDADLQDDPDSVSMLLSELEHRRCDVVCAGRRGRHQQASRRIQAWLFRSVRWVTTLGRVPRDAGLFHVATNSAVRRMTGVAVPGDDPLVVYARTGSCARSVPVQRSERAVGSSGYGLRDRLALAARSLRGAFPRFGQVAVWPATHDISRMESK